MDGSPTLRQGFRAAQGISWQWAVGSGQWILSAAFGREPYLLATGNWQLHLLFARIIEWP